MLTFEKVLNMLQDYQIEIASTFCPDVPGLEAVGLTYHPHDDRGSWSVELTVNTEEHGSPSKEQTFTVIQTDHLDSALETFNFLAGNN